MRKSGVAFFLSLVAAAGPALAHHSIAAVYDRDRTVSVEGVLSKVELQNPHSMLQLTVPGANGRATVWMLEGRGVSGMTRMGFDHGAVAIGDKVTVSGSPARSGEHSLWLTGLETAGGKHYDFGFRGQRAFGAP